MIISRYLSKEIFQTLLATTAIFLLIFICGQLLSYMRSAASGNLSFNAIALLLSLQTPVLLTILLPLSLFLGILLAYGRLYADSEMTVLAACGFGNNKLYRIALRFALGTAIVVASLSLWIAPKMEELTARTLTANKSEALQLLIPGRFNAIANNKWVFYVENVDNKSKQLQNVFAAEEPNSNKKLGAVFAKIGYQKVDVSGNKFLVLENGNRYNGQPGQRDYQIISFNEYGTRLDQNTGKLSSNEKIYHTAKLLRERMDPKLSAELNWRIGLPISAFILSLLAVPLSKVNPRHGRYIALIPATLFYIIYINLLFLGRNWLAHGTIPLFAGMWWAHAIMLGMAGLLIWLRARTN